MAFTLNILESYRVWYMDNDFDVYALFSYESLQYIHFLYRMLKEPCLPIYVVKISSNQKGMLGKREKLN